MGGSKTNRAIPRASLDWSLCLICQMNGGKDLRSPCDSGRDDAEGAFQKFVVNYQALTNSTSSPFPCVQEMIANKGKWHRNCRKRYDDDKVRRGEKRTTATPSPSAISAKRSRTTATVAVQRCVFCDQNDSRHLHQVMTLELSDAIKRIAIALGDFSLVSALPTDLVAGETKYHKNCLSTFNNRHRSLLRNAANSRSAESEIKTRAMVQLIEQMELDISDGTTIFQLHELFKTYTSLLASFGAENHMNVTRFKNHILSHFKSFLKEVPDGRTVTLAVETEIATILRESRLRKTLEDSYLLIADCASSIRHSVFEHPEFQFRGKFDHQCQTEAVPEKLKCLISLILYGATKNEKSYADTQQCLSISQLIMSSIKKKAKSSNSSINQNKEIPLPLYLGLYIHSNTRSKKIISHLHHLGLSVSYDHVIKLEKIISASVCSKFVEDNAVVPTALQLGRFTTAAIDNLDHNPSSNSSKDSFHGTAISLFQAISHADPVISSVAWNPSCNRTESLPDFYAFIPETPVTKEWVKERKLEGEWRKPDQDKVSSEKEWLLHAILAKELELHDGSALRWSTFYASLATVPDFKMITGMLPVFYEHSTDPSTVLHGLRMTKQAIETLNPGQTTVIEMDQPIFAIAKMLQWALKEELDDTIVLLGGLHLEMAMWSTVGDLLLDSGWKEILSEAGVVGSGTADGLLRATHLKKTRYAHEVFSLALFTLQNIEYNKNTTGITFADWKEQQKNENPTFYFWDSILQLELLVLNFVRSHRVMDLTMYTQTLTLFVPWFFALDHTHYSRWVPVHLFDLMSMPENVRADLESAWVVQKTSRRFSSIPIDQAHEQNNAVLKGEGGVIGITSDPELMKRWMTSGPEVARILSEFQDTVGNDKKDTEHHEAGLASQKRFQKDLKKLIGVFQDNKNPFAPGMTKLINVYTREFPPDGTFQAFVKMRMTGEAQHEEYLQKVVTCGVYSVYDPIKRNNFPLFSTKVKSTPASKISQLKNNCSLFSNLYISNQHRQGDPQNFFRYENLPYPPSISENGLLRKGTKADLLNCLPPTNTFPCSSNFDVKIFDGAAMVHMIKPSASSTFEDYVHNMVARYLLDQFQTCKRIDVVLDEYFESSTKQQCRDDRGSGMLREVSDATRVGNWSNFLGRQENKKKLFPYLSKLLQYTEWPNGKSIFVTKGENGAASHTGQNIHLPIQEEADTKIAGHVYDALQTANNIMVRTVDTDVVVILLGHFERFQARNSLANIIVAFGTKKSFRYLSINLMYSELGSVTCRALPFFHALTGCDTTSFYYCGKKTAWDTWQILPTSLNVFISLSHKSHPSSVSNEEMQLLERFIILWYDKKCDDHGVNAARLSLFKKNKNNRQIEMLPPTLEALKQHVLRSILQAKTWLECLDKDVGLYRATDWGWKASGDRLSPFWTTLPHAESGCVELTKCGCKGTCLKGNCSCKKVNLPCTDNCRCTDQCQNKSSLN